MGTGLTKLVAYIFDGRGCMFPGVSAGGWYGEGSVIKREDHRYDMIATRASHVLSVPESMLNTLLAQNLPPASSMVRRPNERMG